MALSAPFSIVFVGLPSSPKAPAFCSHCSGTGSVDSFDWIDYGNSSKKVLVGQDDCPSCLAQGLCPACGSALGADRSCSACGWSLFSSYPIPYLEVFFAQANR